MKSNKYLHIGVSMLALLFLGALYAWSVIRIHIAEAFPAFGAAKMSFAFTLASITFCLGGFFGGRFSRRYSPACAAKWAALLVTLGFIVCSFMEYAQPGGAVLWLYLGFGLLVGFGIGAAYNAVIGGTSPCYPERLGLVSGILLMGFSFGSLLIGVAVEALCKCFSIFTVLRLVGLSVGVMAFLGSLFLRRPQPVVKKAERENGYTPGEMLSQKSFWVYFLWNTLTCSAGLLVINSSADIALAYGAAAALGLLVSVFNGGSRPVTGWIMDRMGQFGGMLLVNAVMIFGAALLVFGAVGKITFLVVTGMVCIGMTHGGGVTISARVIHDLYGEKFYAVNFSLSNFCMIPAAFVGPWISGTLQDRADGDFFTTFVMVVILAALALADIFLLRRCLKKEG